MTTQDLTPRLPPCLGTSIPYGNLRDSYHLLSRKFQCYQTMVGPPTTFDIGDELRSFMKKTKGEFVPVAHGPYILNLVNIQHPTYYPSIQFLKKVAELGSDGLQHYVIHTGKAFTKKQFLAGGEISSVVVNESLDKALEEILPVFEAHKITLCLENTVGDDFGSDPASLGFLIAKIREYNSRHLRLCYDTEHAFAANQAALDNVKFYDMVKRVSSVVHLNAIPEGVERGSRKDKHSATRLEDCSQFSVEQYKKFFTEFSGMPLILERNDLSLSDADRIFLTGDALNG